MPRRTKKTVLKKSSRSHSVSATVSRKPTKTSRKQTKQSRLESIKQRFDGWKWTESYNSLLLGVVVVIVTVLFVASFFHNRTQLQQTSSIATTAPTPTATPSPVPGKTYTQNGKTYYVVKPNDSLWLIALALYNSGYKWADIAQANNLANPSTIFTGDTLVIPNAPQPSTLGQIEQAQATPIATPAATSITSSTYTVVKGDNLWDIAVRAYADGYKWTDIAKANNLADPGLIFSGNVLTIPR